MPYPGNQIKATIVKYKKIKYYTKDNHGWLIWDSEQNTSSPADRPAVNCWKDRLQEWLIYLLLAGLAWSCLYLILHREVLPPGGLFQLLLLLSSAQLMGMATAYLGLPSLLGMLVTGIVLRSSGLFQLDGVYPDLVIISR